jgi:hypothetical protein
VDGYFTLPFPGRPIWSPAVPVAEVVDDDEVGGKINGGGQGGERKLEHLRLVTMGSIIH